MKWKPVVYVWCLCAVLPLPTPINGVNAKTTTTHTYTETFGDSPNRLLYASEGLVWDVVNHTLRLAQLNAAQHTEPAAVADSAGNIILAWTDTRLGHADIYAQKLDAAGNTLWPADVRVNSDIGTHIHHHPAIAVDALGNSVIAWNDVGESCCNLYAQRLDVAGNKLWLADSHINQNPNTATDEPPALAVLPDGTIAIGWADARSSFISIYLQKLSAGGTPLAPNDVLFVPTSPNPTAQHNPVLRTVGNNLALAWADCASTVPVTCRARAQQLNKELSPRWSSDVALSAITHTLMMTATRPLDLAVDQTDQALVAAWTDPRDGHADVYAQRVDADGKRVWPNDVRVNSDIGTSLQSDASVDVSALGSVFAWRDQRQASPGLFAQLLNAQGDKQWTVDTHVSDAAAIISAEARPVARASSTGPTVAWADIRLGYPTLLTQRLTITGERTTLTNTQVPLSDTRFFASGGITSPVVITNTLPVRRARLVADYALNGGAITFYLSNGHGWITATPGIALSFPITGTELAWKAKLLANPQQTRSPLITRVEINYDEQVGGAGEDAYEADDTCATATGAQIDGIAQPHTFHRNGDVDWLHFDVVTGTTYVVQTSRAQSNADTQLELLINCAQPPVASNQNTLGNEARVVWQAPARGTAWARISNNPPNVFGPDTGYDISVRVQSVVTSVAPLVIIVAGRNSVTDALQANFNAVGDQAYRAFITTGTPKNRIRYLSHNASRDPDGNGLNDDIYASPTITRVRDAIQTWARQMGAGPGVPLYLVVVQHGAPDEIILDADQRIHASTLNLWLSNLEAATGSDAINIVIEGSQSGSFIEAVPSNPATISARNRIIIASTHEGMNAYPSLSGAHFSDMLWSGLAHSQDIFLAFATARDAVVQYGLTQMPLLDDNGDAIANAEDGALAHARGIGLRFSGDVPVIHFVSAEDVVSGTTTLRAQAQDDFALQRVWAEVYAPDFVEPPVAPGWMPTLALTRPVFSAAGDNLFAASLTGLGLAGCYHMVVNAVDLEGHYALPQVTQVCVPFTVYLPTVRR